MLWPKLRSRKGSWTRDYLSSTLAPRLGITEPFEEVVQPDLGKRSSLLLVRPREADAFVARFIQDKKEAQALLAASEFTSERGLSTPRIVFHDITAEHFRKHGFGVIVEDQMEGEHREAEELDPSSLDRLAGAMALFHGVESEKWGDLGSPRSGNFYRPMVLAKMENRIASIEKFDEEFTPEIKGAILDFARKQEKQWDGGPPYALTHDKINKGNVIFGPSGTVTFLDLATLRYGAPEKDLVSVLYYFCEGPEQEQALLKTYFAKLPSDRAEQFKKSEPLFRAWHHLSRWAAKARGRSKKKKKKSKERAEYPSRLRERDAMLAWIEKGNKS